MTASSETTLSAEDSSALLNAKARLGELADIESIVTLSTEWNVLREQLSGFRMKATSLWSAYDHVVVRGVPFSNDGSTLLLLARALFSDIKTYRGGQVVKHFRMSPWTKALSHTLAAGHFHTDINTAAEPPVGTLIQCLRPDPDAPRHGQLRIVRLADLRVAIENPSAARLRQFLLEDTVTMVNDTSPGSWTGRILADQSIRFHPETLRAGQRRCGSNPSDLEECLEALHGLALDLSEPIDLGPGDAVIVSNRRALHQRGACTARFLSSRRDFESREVAVLHTLGEPS